MTKLKAGIVQMEVKEKEIDANIKKHLVFIDKAINEEIDFIIFPEMSITGYMIEEGREYGFYEDDERLSLFQEKSDTGKIVISAGIPLIRDGKVYIGQVLFVPQKKREYYIKQYLHPGEERVFDTMECDSFEIEIRGNKIINAVCYDIEVKEHENRAKMRGGEIYAASIFYSKKGISGGKERLEEIARNTKCGVLVSNYTGVYGKINAGGKSGIISNDGESVMCAEENEEVMLIGEYRNGVWKNIKKII